MGKLLLDNVTIDNLAGIYTEVAEQIGIENAFLIFQHFGGQQISFPIKFYSSDYISERMRKEYNGRNTRELAKKYQYSESRVRQMLADNK